MAKKLEMQKPDLLKEIEDNPDVILVCGKNKAPIPASKLLLSNSSEYFQAMFSSGWEESTNREVQLPTIEAEEMEVILEYLYTGKFVEDFENRCLLKRLLSASHFLLLRAMFEWCYKKLAIGLRPDCFLEIYNLAEFYDDEGMMIFVGSVLALHFAQVRKSEDFLKMSERQMMNVVQLLSSSSHGVDIVEDFNRWTEIDIENREETLLKIFRTFDLSTDLLLELLQEMHVKNCRLHKLLKDEARLRMSTSLKIVWGCSEGKQVFKVYDVMRNEWCATKVLPFHIGYYMSGAWFDGYVYIFGGNHDQSSKIVQFCPITNKVESFRSLKIPVFNPSVVASNHSIYVVDGIALTNTTNVVQSYNPLIDGCENLAKTQKIHTAPKVFCFSGYLYVLGSFENENSLERFDHKSNTWTILTYVPGRIQWCEAGICGEKLYVVPIHNQNHLNVYDFSSSIWDITHFDHGPNAVHCLKAAVVKENLVLVALDFHGALHLRDVKLGLWIRRLESNIDLLTYKNGLLV